MSRQVDTSSREPLGHRVVPFLFEIGRHDVHRIKYRTRLYLIGCHMTYYLVAFT